MSDKPRLLEPVLKPQLFALLRGITVRAELNRDAFELPGMPPASGPNMAWSVRVALLKTELAAFGWRPIVAGGSHGVQLLDGTARLFTVSGRVQGQTMLTFKDRTDSPGWAASMSWNEMLASGQADLFDKSAGKPALTIVLVVHRERESRRVDAVLVAPIEMSREGDQTVISCVDVERLAMIDLDVEKGAMPTVRPAPESEPEYDFEVVEVEPTDAVDESDDA